MLRTIQRMFFGRVLVGRRRSWWSEASPAGQQSTALTLVGAVALVVVPAAGYTLWHSGIGGFSGWSHTTTHSASTQVVDGRILRLVDGDTVALGSERIRVLGIDAPESHEPRCQNELAAGLRAKERLGQLIATGQVQIKREGQDVYKRTLARVSVGGAEVGQVLVSEGLALPWDASTEARASRLKHWCG